MKLAIVGVVIVVLVLGFLYLMNNNSTKNNNNPSLSSYKSSIPPLSSQTPTSSPGPSESPDAEPVTYADNLIAQDIKIGTGVEVKKGDTVTVNYLGTLENGQKFDSSYDRNQPFTTQIGVGSVIAGWDEGLIGMRVGGKRKLTIPSDLGYGAQGAGTIPPNSTLIFEIELLKVQ